MSERRAGQPGDRDERRTPGAESAFDRGDTDHLPRVGSGDLAGEPTVGFGPIGAPADPPGGVSRPGVPPFRSGPISRTRPGLPPIRPGSVSQPGPGTSPIRPGAISRSRPAVSPLQPGSVSRDRTGAPLFQPQQPASARADRTPPVADPARATEAAQPTRAARTAAAAKTAAAARTAAAAKATGDAPAAKTATTAAAAVGAASAAAGRTAPPRTRRAATATAGPGRGVVAEAVDGARRMVGPGAPAKRRWGAIALVLVPVTLAAVACAHYQPGPSTARVTLSAVRSTTSGTGSLQAINEQNLGFDHSGKLAELNVAVGQRVVPGQVLARIDDDDADVTLRKANAKLATEMAELDRIQDSGKVDAASDDADKTKDIHQATRDQMSQIDKANEGYVDQARRRVAGAQADLRAAQMEYAADDQRCRESIGGDSRQRPGEVNQPGGLRGSLFVPAPIESSACARARRSGAEVALASRRVSEAQGFVRQAMRRRDVDRAEQRIAVDNADRDAAAAHNNLLDTRQTLPDEIAAQQAAVDDARADVDAAQRGIANTVLRAPVAGTVSAINGTVGEYLPSGSDTTALAPGGRVPLPSDSSGVGSRDDDGSQAQRPGGSSFMVLDNVDSYQVIVPFQESDAAKLAPGQHADVTFDSVPDLICGATVVSMSPTGTQIKDVTNYYATLVLNKTDPRLKEGMTADAAVVTSEVPNVLVVPNSAIDGGGASGIVTVLEPGGQKRQVQVQLGASGGGVTQVVSGLREGQQVVTSD
jgi:HlyD family secretion protein